MDAKDTARELELIRKAKASRDFFVPFWLELEALYDAVVSDEILKEKRALNRSAIAFPIARITLDIIVAIFDEAFFPDGDLPLEITAIGDNDQDAADVLTTACKYYYKHSITRPEMLKAFLSALIFKTGALKSFFDANTQSIETRYIFPTDIAFDPYPDHIKDVRFVTCSYTQTVQEIKSLIASSIYSAKISDISRNTKDDLYKRVRIDELYSYGDDGKWYVSSYATPLFVRRSDNTSASIPLRQKVVLVDGLPTSFGYAIESLPSMNPAKRDRQIAAYGDSLVKILEPLIKEYNLKINQRNDLIEELITPSYVYEDGAIIDPSQLYAGPGTAIRSNNINGLKRREVAGTVELLQDLDVVNRAIEDTSGVNGISKGQTSSSDRRSDVALANINRNATKRIASYIKTFVETIGDPWAERFVRLVYKNATDDLIKSLSEKDTNPLGRYGTRTDFAKNFRVRLGINVNKQQKINDLISIFQILMNSGAHSGGLIILSEYIKEVLGENTNVQRLLEELITSTKGGDKEQTDGVSDGGARQGNVGNGQGQEQSFGVPSGSQSYFASKELAGFINPRQ